MRKVIWVLFGFVVWACQDTDLGGNAQAIIDKAIEVSGGANYDSLRVSFQFRDILYASDRGARGSAT